MPAAVSIRAARPGSSAPPPASRILPRTTSSARPAGIAGVAWARSSLSATFGDVPAVDLIAVLIGLPVVAALGGWLLGGRQPA
ncbi:MAG TPA: hypothetical protein VG123_30005, partial [Streptosporangiaceae bacterium]|nr:hypothetical protein [Streptosporangiaceae bacterium]